MFLKIVPKSSFAKNILTLLTGTTIAQAIPIAISPILTRLYTPQDFGVLALFISIVFIFSSISTARYEVAIMLPKSKEEAINVAALSFLINLLISAVLLIIIAIFYSEIITLLGNKEIGFWLYFAPLSILFLGIFNILNYLNTRDENYKDISKAKVYKSVVLASLQIVVALFKSGASGLITGQIFSQLIANTKLAKNILKDKSLISSINFKSIKKVAKKYIDFPKYSMPTALIHSLGNDFLNILISAFFNIATLGFYSFAIKMLGIPTSLIGESISQVFFKEAVREKHEKDSSKEIFIATTKKLILIAIPLFLSIYIFAEDAFAFIFGEDWRVAGEYAKIVTPIFFANFIFVSVSSIFDIYKGLKIELLLQTIMMIGSILIIYLMRDYSFKEFLKVYTIFSCIIYLISYIVAFNLAKGSNE